MPLIWWPLLRPSNYFCSYLAVCLPSAELPIDPVLSKHSAVENFVLDRYRSLSWSLIGADSFILKPFCRPASPLGSWAHRGDFSGRKMASALTLLLLLQITLHSSVTSKKGEIQHWFIWWLHCREFCPLSNLKLLNCSLSSVWSTSHHRWDWWAGVKARVWGWRISHPLMWAGVHTFHLKPPQDYMHRHRRVDTVRPGLFAWV